MIKIQIDRDTASGFFKLAKDCLGLGPPANYLPIGVCIFFMHGGNFYNNYCVSLVTFPHPHSHSSVQEVLLPSRSLGWPGFDNLCYFILLTTSRVWGEDQFHIEINMLRGGVPFSSTILTAAAIISSSTIINHSIQVLCQGDATIYISALLQHPHTAYSNKKRGWGQYDIVGGMPVYNRILSRMP